MEWRLRDLEGYCRGKALFLRIYTYLKRIFTVLLYCKYLVAYIILGLFKKRVLLFNYTALARHLGCQATSAALIRLIKQKGRAVIFPLPLIYGKYNFYTLHPLSQIDSFAVRYLKKNIFFRFLVYISDSVIINGEGNIYEYADWKRGIVPVELLLQAYIAKKKYGKKVLLTNHSFDFIRNSNSGFKEYAQFIYSQLDSIVVRDRRSYDRLVNLSVSPVTLSADAAFLTTYANKPWQDGWLMKKIGLKKEFAVIFLKTNVTEIPRVTVSRMIELIGSTFHQEVVFMPTTDSEAVFLRDFQNEAKVVNFNYSLRHLINFLAQATFTISGRFHYCIFSTLAGTPFIPFKSNTDKIDALLDELDYPLKTLNFSSYNERQLTDNLSYLLNNRQSLRNLLDNRLKHMRQLAFHNIPEGFP